MGVPSGIGAHAKLLSPIWPFRVVLSFFSALFFSFCSFPLFFSSLLFLSSFNFFFKVVKFGLPPKKHLF